MARIVVERPVAGDRYVRGFNDDDDLLLGAARVVPFTLLERSTSTKWPSSASTSVAQSRSTLQHTLARRSSSSSPSPSERSRAAAAAH